MAKSKDDAVETVTTEDTTEDVKEQKYYVVEKGDTLKSIAIKCLGSAYKTRELKKINGLISDVLYVGTKLKLSK